ncbi:fatty acid desaturase protein [Rutstroemia sp. NJR-2017a BBW]|nr:fatty acid desaturase protein [Rutstroemia sp. NJR-2017a BBW]
MPSTNVSSKDKILSRRQVEGLIADGRSIVIVDRAILKVDGWMKYHPGGDKAILHMIGRDATDEVNALHSAETRKSMMRYQIGRIEGRWKNFVPPIQYGKFRPYVEGACDESEEEDDFLNGETSSESSRIPSPTFDEESHDLRRRVLSEKDRAESSASSVSSAPDLDDGMAHFDALTREQIDLDHAKYPSLDLATQDEIVRKYRLLDQRIRAEGLYDCNYTAYAIEACRYTFLFCMFIMFLRWEWYGTSAVFLGCLWHQLVFTVHDAGHMGITHDFTTDTVIGILISDFIGGLSIGWWKRNHNVHHIVTNSPEHDPDIEHIPFFAISHRFLTSLFSTYYERVMTYDAFARFVIPYQSYLYYPILLFGRFNLYRLSWEYLILGLGPKKGPAWWHRWLELAGQVFFWTWFGYGIVYKTIPTASQRILFVMVSHMVTMPVHAQITLSHFSMSTSELGPHESFPQKMLRTTMDIDCPQWLDFFHGGLQFQAIHHLFPRMPRHNLRRAQKLVLEFCNDVGIPYALYGFVDGSKDVIGRLEEVGRQAAILAKCQKSMAEKGEILHGH